MRETLNKLKGALKRGVIQWIPASPVLEFQAIYKGQFNPVMRDPVKMQIIADNVRPIWGEYKPNELLVSKIGYVYDKEEGTTLGRLDANLNFYVFTADMV